MFFYVGSGASENREVHAWMRRIGFVSNTEDSYWHRAGRCARVQRVAPGTHLIVWE